MLSGRALALVLLAWSLFRVLLRYLGKQVPGMVLFERNYGAERLLAIEPSERRSLTRFSQCIACGRCDLGEDGRMIASHGAYPGLMQLVRASSRSMPDFDAAALGFSHVPEQVLRGKTAQCPVAMPFVDLARFVRSKARSGDERQPAGDAAARGQLGRAAAAR